MLLFLLAAPSAAAATVATVSWNQAQPLPQAVSPELFSFTADFHAPESSCHGVPTAEARCWQNASILNADLTHPRLRSAMKLLAPAFWRIGGSPADMTTYGGFGRTRCPRSCAPLVTEACGPAVFDSEDSCKACLKKHGPSLGASCAAQNPGFADICKLGGDDAFYCLTPPRWAEILRLGAAVGAKVVFGLNYASPTVWVGNGTAAKWSSANARELLQYTHDHQLPLHGVELGNELNIKLREPNTTRLGAAFAELRELIDEIWKNNKDEEKKDDCDDEQPTPKPVVIGPDVSWVHDQPGDEEGTAAPNAWLKSFLQSFTPHAVTFHQ